MCRDRSSSRSALRALLSCCSLNNSARVTRVPSSGKDRRHCEEKLPEPDPRPARLRPVVLNKCRMACCCDVHVRFDTRYSCCRADASENRLPPVFRPLVFVFSSTSSFLSSSLRLIHPENPCTSSPFKCFVPMPAGLCLPGTVLTWRVPSSTLLYPKSTLSAHVADLIRLRAPRLLLLMFCEHVAL